MARKKNVSSHSARKEEIVDYDFKRLKQMSAKEIHDYYDRVEPLSDDEVNTIYDRVIPKIAYEIASNNQQKKSHYIGRSIKKTILVAICITLMLPVIAQALGIPVWAMFITWTKDNLQIDISCSNEMNETLIQHVFSEEEKTTWGDDVFNAFTDIGIYPVLPRYMPDGFALIDLLYYTEDSGYSYVNAFYKNDADQRLNLIVNICTAEDYTHGTSTEYDQGYVNEIVLDGVAYKVVSNLSNNTAFWFDSIGSYTLSGNISIDALEDMLHSIKRTS